MNSFQDDVKKIVDEQAKSVFQNMDCIDIQVVYKNINKGLEKPIYLYDNSDTIHTLDEVSGISNVLELESNYLPLFYVYCLVLAESSDVNAKRLDLLKGIGAEVGRFVFNKIVDELKKIDENMRG